ncbi:VOC family protein [Microbacterium sp. SA39]|uniref:VOC family protein n=1 Tax=Microbacterium sp. SA39 TaxID=1263625 RepID=UPI0005FA0AEE|nr:VOC family protein [Microbacterium sp. SA39]KJQ53460.1 Glyoxalase-like domain protein [Microbacterium sp. SA39]
MSLGEHPVRASIVVTDMARAAAFYEGVLGLAVVQVSPSADIAEGARVYAGGRGTLLNVFETPAAGSTRSTVATWYVDDLDGIVAELTDAGAEFVRYEGFGQDARGIGPRAGGGRIAWVEDPDGNTHAIEADS